MARKCALLGRLSPRMLAGVSAVAILAPLVGAGEAQAVQFNRGDLSGSFDTTLTLGALFRVQSADPDLIGVANGGRAYSINGDNGDLNYDKGLVSLAARATHELKLNYANLGAFARATYFYDAVNAKKDSSSFARTGKFDLSDEAVDRVGRDFELLDAFVFGDFAMGESGNVSVRLGNQVLSWGESTFIANGINVISPINVSALRIPGSELKEAFLPVPIADINVSFNENFSVEAFYQFKWDKTEPEAAGTFFSTSDAISPGADHLFIGFGNYLFTDSRNQGAVPGSAQGVFPRSLYPNPALDGPLTCIGVPGTVTLRHPCNSLTPFGTVVPRLEDDEPSDQGQFGFAARLFSPDLMNTEFGAYFINYHSRLPVLSSQLATYEQFLVPGNSSRFTDLSGYRAEYPEDIQLFGLSFNTNIAGISLQGEYSFRKDQPLQLDDVELLQATLAAPSVLGSISQGQAAGTAAAQQSYQTAVNQVLQIAAPTLVGTPFTSLPAPLQSAVQSQIAAAGGPASYQAALTAGATAGANQGAAGAAALFNTNQIVRRNGLIPTSSAAAATAFLAQNYFGKRLQGWELFDVSQFQMTATKTLPPIVGADQVVLLGEAGFTWVHDMPGGETLRLEGPGTVVGGNPAFLGRGGMPDVATDGFGTEFSWGYRMVARFDYLNAFNGVNLFPSISWQHDVQGTTPAPLGNFVEDRMAIGLGLRAVVRETYTIDLNYSTFFGGGNRNLISDRDFVSASIKYSF
ncbi:DUF1302 domain-containing protein [Oleisolibacter albus]|uniref:DUF1302 domain-containing protein n=1 Tax=Oleisolibacter albus TaxID=2171757 RepID=UPI0013902DA4|nr:DUF1302 domain-containing protein [Oleisolibacter albus]